MLAVTGMPGQVAATTYHTLTQTPGLEFVADETFVTSTTARTAFFTWDADWLFMGYQGEQVINPPPGRRVAWYFDTDPRPNPMSGAGTATAVSIGTQNWTLPFLADYVFFVWPAGGAVLLRWDGTAWVDHSNGPWWVLEAGPIDPYIKVGIPRSMLGSPQQVYALGFLVSEETGAETTYGSWPNDSLVGGDGYKPAGQFTHWWGYTLGPGISPNDLAYHSLTLPVELMGFAVE
ncbi:MAG TPA: hypothetical protein VFQ51_15620 [Vicinamibacteria bacterium]|nr:hypothetical protein [Vicinamibacteria bacterium]